MMLERLIPPNIRRTSNPSATRRQRQAFGKQAALGHGSAPSSGIQTPLQSRESAFLDEI